MDGVSLCIGGTELGGGSIKTYTKEKGSRVLVAVKFRAVDGAGSSRSE